VVGLVNRRAAMSPTTTTAVIAAILCFEFIRSPVRLVAPAPVLKSKGTIRSSSQAYDLKTCDP
jgi:hypothetical protein